MAPTKPIVIFDLHGVVFQTNYKKILKLFWHTPKKYNLLLAVIDPRFLYYLIKLIRKGAVPEEYIMCLAHKIPRLHTYIQNGIEIANAQNPINKTVSILHELKNRHTDLYIFSNIGEKTISDLKKKYPAIFNLFVDACYANAHDQYIKKPRRNAFEKCARQFGHHFGHMIFIDNKVKNIRMARLLGMDGILFRNPGQLRSELIKRHILA